MGAQKQSKKRDERKKRNSSFNYCRQSKPAFKSGSSVLFRADLFFPVCGNAREINERPLARVRNAGNQFRQRRRGRRRRKRYRHARSRQRVRQNRIL